MKIALAIANTLLSIALAAGILWLVAFGYAVSGRISMYESFRIGGFLLVICTGIAASWIVALRRSTDMTWKVLSFGPLVILAYFIHLIILIN